MVRLVFRPYTQFRRSICTSESLRTSIRVSPDFVLTRHSSPSFGSQRVRSRYAPPSKVETSRRCAYNSVLVNLYRIPSLAMISPQFVTRQIFTFITPLSFTFSMTCVHVRLLGPCFKTGQADHACFRLQFWTEPKKFWPPTSTHNMLRLPVHISYVPCSSKPLTATNACSLKQQPQKYLETRTQTTRICSTPAPKIPF
jgi:hypothetical protein